MIRNVRHFSSIIIALSCLLNAGGQDPGEHQPLIQTADSVKSLGEVNVVAYRINTRLHRLPGSISVLSGSDLSISDGNSPATALNSLPGVTMQTGTLTTNRIVIRGMGSRTPYNTNRIRAYLNDIPLTSADGISSPEEIDLSAIGRMEIIKGPSSALYGSGLGGAINLYTPEITGNGGNADVQFGSWNTLKASLSGNIRKENAQVWGSVNRLHSDGYRENNHYDRSSILTTGMLRLTEWSVKTTLLAMNVNGGIPSSLGETQFRLHPETAASSWKDVGGFKKYFRGLAAAEITGNISDKLSNQLIIFGRWNDNYEKRPFNNLDDMSLSGGLRNKLTLHGLKYDMVAGAEWITENYKWRLDKDNLLLNENSERRRQVNLFAVIFYRPVAKLNISVAGALNRITYRLSDHYLLNGDQSGKRLFPLIISPRLGINYAPDNHIALYASAGHGFSLPSPEETLLPGGEVNKDIKPEDGFQFETGIRLNLFKGALEADAAIYRIELTNLLVTKRISEDIFTGINAGRTRHYGIELLLRNRFFDFSSFPGKLTSAITFTSSYNRFRTFTDDGISYDGKHLPGIPARSFQMQLKWNMTEAVEFLTWWQCCGDQYLNDSNSLEYPGYSLINLKLTSRFRLKRRGPVSLYAGINNLSDTRYASMLVVNSTGFAGSEPRFYYPGLPRHGFIGARYVF